MKTICDKERCTGCSACFAACPKNCITMCADDEGFFRPQIDEMACIDCGKCRNVCPANVTKREKTVVDAVALNVLDEELRKSSSSGGAFSILAEEVLDNGGAVVGVAFLENFLTAHHEIITNKEGLSKLRGSKYFQSEPNGVFLRIKELLESGKTVLFSGTPCQVEGLQSFLGRAYDNLICADLICHGVPSAAVWQRYLDEFSDVKEVSFRDKSNGWKNYSLRVRFGKDIYICKNKENTYSRLFLHDVGLRPSCYDCSMKSLVCRSDLTLGDLWGAETLAPEMDDDKGTSLVLIHTQKGKDLLDAVAAKVTMKRVVLENAVRFNAAIAEGVKRPKERNTFFEDLGKMSFEKLGKKYLRPTAKERLKQVLEKCGLLEPAKKIKGKICNNPSKTR